MNFTILIIARIGNVEKQSEGGVSREREIGILNVKFECSIGVISLRDGPYYSRREMAPIINDKRWSLLYTRREAPFQ